MEPEATTPIVGEDEAQPGQKAGMQIGLKAFIQSVIILLALMLAAGLLTRLIPAGSYARLTQGGREVIDPQSFQYVPRPDYPVWRWFTAPLEVLWGPDAVTIITIILFILMVGSSFAVLDRCGILQAAIARLVAVFGGRKYWLLLALSLFFMLLGAFFGIFEEVVPLVPLMIALAYFLGWDSLTGLGMSILATNLGFSAAVTNPFTIGVAQKLAGLPLFSGAGLRIVIFLAIYALFAVFIVGYARRVERDPRASLVYADDQAVRKKFRLSSLDMLRGRTARLGPAQAWLAVSVGLIVLVLLANPFVPVLSDLSMLLVGLLFAVGGLGAGWLSGTRGRALLRAAGEGASGIAPGILLILLAASVKHIVVHGGIMDTILHAAALAFSRATPVAAAGLVYALALGIEFFVASGSAKAFLMMPILLPLADLVGVTRQVTVLAYCFGDGFSNLAYPTNPVLLICLGLSVVSYPKWLRWTLKLWAWIAVVSLAFLAVGVAIHYGPF